MKHMRNIKLKSVVWVFGYWLVQENTIYYCYRIYHTVHRFFSTSTNKNISICNSNRNKPYPIITGSGGLWIRSSRKEIICIRNRIEEFEVAMRGCTPPLNKMKKRKVGMYIVIIHEIPKSSFLLRRPRCATSLWMLLYVGVKEAVTTFVILIWLAHHLFYSILFMPLILIIINKLRFLLPKILHVL